MRVGVFDRGDTYRRFVEPVLAKFLFDVLPGFFQCRFIEGRAQMLLRVSDDNGSIGWIFYVALRAHMTDKPPGLRDEAQSYSVTAGLGVDLDVIVETACEHSVNRAGNLS